jgi:hypothetical protein
LAEYVGVEEWRPGKLLTIETVERWLTELPSDTRQVVLRLGQWSRTGPFADSWLQGALCLLHRQGIHTAAVVPPLTLAGDRAAYVFGERDALIHADRSMTPTESTLASTVSGLVVGQLCAFDTDHGHIAEQQRDALRRRSQVYGLGQEKALVFMTEQRPSAVSLPTFRDRETDFDGQLRQLVRGLNARHAEPRHGHRYRGAGWLGHLKDFAFEATENSYDHGRLDLDRRPIPSLQFVKLRRVIVGRNGFDPATLAPALGSALSEYLRRLAQHDERAGQPWQVSTVHLLELTVADGGIGVAACMAGDLGVYEQDLADEASYVMAALRPYGTSKPAGQVGRGQGFGKMLRACHRLRGLAMVRTGRLCLTRTYLDPTGSLMGGDFVDQDGDDYRPEINGSPLPLLAGTSVSLLFPDRPVAAVGWGAR